MIDLSLEGIARLNEPEPSKNGSSALLRVLAAIDDKGGIHDRFMPDLVIDIRDGLAAIGWQIAATAPRDAGLTGWEALSNDDRVDIAGLAAQYPAVYNAMKMLGRLRQPEGQQE